MDPISRFDGRYFFLSNFYPSPLKLVMLDTEFIMPTGEHAFHAAKVVCSGRGKDMQIKWLLALAADSDPSRAKRAGRNIHINLDRWNSMSTNVMRRVQELKYEQHLDLRELLLATGSKTLVEGNTWGDRVWGQVNGEGENRLGVILMDVRASWRERQEGGN